MAHTLPMPLLSLLGFLPFGLQPCHAFALTPGLPRNLATPCLGREPKGRVVTEIVPVGLSKLWTAITLDCRVRLQRGLNQSCSPRQGLSNAMLQSQVEFWEEVDSRLLVVESQGTNLTPGPSFAHNLGCRCPNDQCKTIFNIYVSRPFQ